VEQALQHALNNEPLYILIEAEDLRERWVTRSFVLQQFAQRSEDWIPDHIEFPDWLHRALLERASALRSEAALRRLAKQFTGDDERRARLIGALQKQLADSVVTRFARRPWLDQVLAPALGAREAARARRVPAPLAAAKLARRRRRGSRAPASRETLRGGALHAIVRRRTGSARRGHAYDRGVWQQLDRDARHHFAIRAGAAAGELHIDAGQELSQRLLEQLALAGIERGAARTRRRWIGR
jgi:hypothetical protein